MLHTARTVTVVWVFALLCLSLLSVRASAAELLRELSGTPFYTECHPWLAAQALDDQSQPAFDSVALLGQHVTAISGFSVSWPKSQQKLNFIAGQYGDMRGTDGAKLETSICAGLADGRMQLVDLGGTRLPGFLAKVSVWPTERSENCSLIILLSFSDGYEDSEVRGFRVAADGSIERVDTNNAHTQWGNFQLADIDASGTYELLCYRSLDGVLGGLSYRSVRGYDPVANAYKPAAEQHRRFFELQLEWLDWVISTRAKVIANPSVYFDENGFGSFYSAEHNGERYGFDTIIFIDNPDFSRDDAKAAKAASDEAFGRVKRYRDELSAWLSGGAYPATWGLV